MLLGHVAWRRRRPCRAAARGTPRRRAARAGPPRAGACPSRARRATSTSSPVLWPWVSLMRLKWSRSQHRDRERVAVTAGGGDHAAQLGQDRAPVREPGERVLAQQRLQPRALGDELLLELLGARGGLDAREHLAVGHRLDQVVLHARAACPSSACLRRQLGPLDHDDRGAVGHRVGLDVAARCRRSTRRGSARRRAPTRGSARAPRRVVDLDDLVAGLAPARARSGGASGVRAWASSTRMLLPYPLDDRSKTRTVVQMVRPTARSPSTSRCICSTASRRSRSASRRGSAR